MGEARVFIHDYRHAVEYVPKCAGNRDAERPAYVVLRPMTPSENRAYRIDSAKTLDGKVNVARAEKLVDALLEKHVESIHGFVYREHGPDGSDRDEPLVDVRRFVSVAPDELRTELFLVILEGAGLEEGLRKKWSTPPVS
jgi:hypothetical protein